MLEHREYECDICKDECVIVDFERDIAKECSCVPLRRVNRVLRHSRISDEFSKKTFQNFETAGKDQRIVSAFKSAERYAYEFQDLRHDKTNGLGIVGGVGLGKTHLLCAIANHLLSQGVSVRYFNFVTGFKEMFAKYDSSGGGQAVEEIRHELQTCELLMLDDLAKGKKDRDTKRVNISDAVYNEMYAIVEYRYFNKFPIIWSSELFYELIGVLGEATASRLFEMCDIVDVTYKDNEPVGKLNHRLKKFVG